MHGRIILSAMLAIFTTILVAWSPRVLHTQSAERMRIGEAVRDDLLISYDEPHWWAMTKQSWHVFDLERETWESGLKREQAAKILNYGAAAEFDRTVAAATEIARLAGRTLPELPPIERADDLAERGPPIPIIIDELPDSGLSFSRISCGWPFPALGMDTYSHFVYGSSPLEMELELEADDAIGLPWSRQADLMQKFNLKATTHLPTRVLPTGFLLNTLLFFIVWGAILIGPLTIRRHARRLRGRCTYCGYRVHNFPRCPECGRST
jgi:hypothetical protein